MHRKYSLLISIRKIGKSYQYSFDVAKVNGKRKRITKSGFKTKSKATNSGIKALNEYRTMGHYFKEEDISFSDYLDYWMAFTLAFLTSCYTGLRTGEVFSLSWEDIDFDNRVIHVRNNIYDKPKDDKGRWFIIYIVSYMYNSIIKIYIFP